MKHCTWCGEEIKPVTPEIKEFGEGPFETDFGPVCDVSCAVDLQIHMDPLDLMKDRWEFLEVCELLKEHADMRVEYQPDGHRIAVVIRPAVGISKWTTPQIFAERMERAIELLYRAGIMPYTYQTGDEAIYLFTETVRLAS